MKDLLECTALITGASSGIGAEIARQLAPLASGLILTARRADRLEALAAELREANAGLRVEVRSCDLLKQEDVTALCDWIEADQVPLDLLVNNAGLGDHGVFETSEWQKVDEMIRVNVVALTYLTHRMIPTLRRHRPGAILNVSSLASTVPVAGLGVYSATKSYVSSFSEALRSELRGTGVSVTQVCPGPVETEFAKRAKRADGTSLPTSTPTFLEVSVEDVASAALRAVSADRARVFPGSIVTAAAMFFALCPMFILRWGMEKRMGTIRDRHVQRGRPGDESYVFDAEFDQP